MAVQGGRNVAVVGNDIHEVGAYGIALGGGDLKTLACAGNSAENNYIHHVGLVGRHAKGIEITGAGNRAAHNLIHDVPQSGVYLWGAKHTVEDNRIRHTCLEGEDTGAIGGGGIDWLSWRGTAIRNNFIHDTLGFGFDPEAGRWRSPYMDTLWCRLSFPAGASRFFVDDVVMEEVNAGDEWQGWQAQGMDRHSLLADPGFVDRNADDFHLRADSPAWKLGFRPIPIERIGPYASPLRATWPIQEAAGARERLPSPARGR